MDPYSKELYEDINGKYHVIVTDNNVPDLQWQFAKACKIDPSDENATSYTVTIDLVVDESFPLVEQSSFSIIKVVELPGVKHRDKDTEVIVVINDRTGKPKTRKGKGKMRGRGAHPAPKPIVKKT